MGVCGASDGATQRSLKSGTPHTEANFKSFCLWASTQSGEAWHWEHGIGILKTIANVPIFVSQNFESGFTAQGGFTVTSMPPRG